jgi:hypothetical protein
MKGCWENTADTPQDFDGVKERNGQFLVVESKDVGKPVPHGQFRALFELHRMGNVAVMFIWGKHVPETGLFWFPNGARYERFTGVDAARRLVTRWYDWADRKEGAWRGETFDKLFPPE